MAFTLDKTDKKILKILLEDGEITNAKIAKQIGMSESATTERTKKLKSNDYILGKRTLINAKKFGLQTVALINVSITRSQKDAVDEFIRLVEEIPNVVEYYQITGKRDFILKVITGGLYGLERIINEHLRKTDLIIEMESNVVLKKGEKPYEFPI